MPVTWWSADTLWAHADAGADWASTGGRERRIGVASEWAAREWLTVIVERAHISSMSASRLGPWLGLSGSTSVDVSISRAGSAATLVYGTGLNQVFKYGAGAQGRAHKRSPARGLVAGAETGACKRQG